MELVISAVAGKSNTWYLLSDKDNSPLQHHQYTHSHLPAIRESAWFQPVVEYDRSGVLTGITNNQLMVVLYFYLNDNSRSATIMKQWLLDAGCNEAQAESLTETIYLARLDKDGLHTHPATANKLPLPINTLMQSTLSDMLSNMGDGTGISWSFDLLPFANNNSNNNSNNNNSNHKVLNLSTVEETAILIEDHHCIIAGYTVDMTSFTELICGEDETLAGQLSALVPLHLRDHYSVGRLFSEHLQVEALLLANKFSSIEHYGLESTGQLKQFSGIGYPVTNRSPETTGSTENPQFSGFPLSHKSHLSHKPNFTLPFYLKLTKQPN